MDEDEILSWLESHPLDNRALNLVSIEILKIIPVNESYIVSLINETINFDKNLDNSSLRRRLFEIIEREDCDDVKEARARICICAISDVDVLDDMMAEMIFFWGKNCGVSQGSIEGIFSYIIRR